MKTFFEFTQGLTQAPQSQMPPTPTGPPVSRAGGQNEDAILEDLSNSLRKVLETKLYPALDRNKLNKQKAMQLLSSLVSEVSNRYGLSNANVMQAAKTGIRTNSEPMSSPPLQPQANG